MKAMVVDVPKNIFQCLILGWILVLTGLKARREGDYLLVTLAPDVPKS